ncbi:MAG: PTS sugar transporter subunit IIC [Deltaproteobacteria bacterium]|nr:PTS sugar transporter subunit IIC [Deltaproteobacteria bacterium]
MKDILLQAFIASIAGGVISLDRSAAFQIMISRPIVAGPLIGIVCGSLTIGIVIGAILELLWIGDLPVGGHIPSHETAAVVIAVAIAASMKGVLPEKGLIGLCILMVIPFAVVCQKADELVRKFNKYYYFKTIESIESGSVSGVWRFNIMAILTLLVINILIFFIFIVSGIFGIIHIHPLITDRFISALAGITVILPIIGIASALNTTHGIKGGAVIFFMAFIISFYLIT